MLVCSCNLCLYKVSGLLQRHHLQKSDTVTEAIGGEARLTQSQYKKWHMINIYLTESDKVAIVDFVKDHKELYNKTNEHFKEKARKEHLC